MSAKKRGPKRQETARSEPMPLPMVKSPVGRPRSIDDPNIRARIIAAVRRGQSRTIAAQLAGIARATLMNALARGRCGESGFVDFLDAIKTAEAQFERNALQRIHRASRLGTWQAAAWLLERRHPQRWGAKKEIRHGLTDEQLARMTPEQHRAELAKLAKEIEQQLAQDAGGGTLQ